MKFNETHISGDAKPGPKGEFTAGAGESGATGSWARLKNKLPPEMRSDTAQGYEVAKQNWITAQLRRESGAAIGDPEYVRAEQQYFPQPGESAKLIKQKRELRAVAEAAMRREAGAGMGASVPGAPASDDLGKEW
jgi:hypothetical protein